MKLLVAFFLFASTIASRAMTLGDLLDAGGAPLDASMTKAVIVSGPWKKVRSNGEITYFKDGTFTGYVGGSGWAGGRSGKWSVDADGVLCNEFIWYGAGRDPSSIACGRLYELASHYYLVEGREQEKDTEARRMRHVGE